MDAVEGGVAFVGLAVAPVVGLIVPEGKEYKDYNGRRYRICTCGAGTKVEQLDYEPTSKKYVVSGTLPNPPFGKGDNVPQAAVPPEPGAPREELDPPPPGVTHINGIRTKPTEGIYQAIVLSRQLQKKCPDEKGCACVLYTYSATRGMIEDSDEVGDARAGARFPVTEIQEEDMRRALRKGVQPPLVVSAHSRGSIHTNNAWENVRDEHAEELFKNEPDRFLNDPEAVAAENNALIAMSRIYPPIVNPELQAKIVRKHVAKKLAEREATEDLNRHVKVVTSGNAIAHPAEGMAGTHVIVVNERGHPVDLVVRSLGSSSGSGADGQPVFRHVVLNEETEAKAQAEVNSPDSVVADKVDSFNNHRFTQYYAETVADEAKKARGMP